MQEQEQRFNLVNIGYSSMLHIADPNNPDATLCTSSTSNLQVTTRFKAVPLSHIKQWVDCRRCVKRLKALRRGQSG